MNAGVVNATTLAGLSWMERLSRSAQIGAVIVASLGVTFGILLLINSQAIAGYTHRRNSHDLQLVTATLQNWSRIYSRVATLQYEKAKAQGTLRDDRVQMMHPKLGQVTLVYKDCGNGGLPAGAPAQLFSVGDRPGEDAQVLLFSSITNSSLCSYAQISLSKLVGLDRAQSAMSNVAIIGANRSILAQIGSSPLPVVQLPEMTPSRSITRKLADSVAMTKQETAGSEPFGASSGVAQMRVGDRDYYVYVQPFSINTPAALCPGAAQASATGGLVSKAALANVPCQFFAVGFMPAETIRTAWLKPPPVILVSFGLALLVVLTLLPALRFFMLGSAEAISAGEAAAIAFGVYAAASIATLSVLFIGETAGERLLARQDARSTAGALAGQVGADLKALRDLARYCSTGMGEGPAANPRIAIYDAGFLTDGGRPDGSGKPACASQRLFPATDISRRSYFQALKQGPADTGKTDNPPHQFAQVTTQIDGISRTVIVFKLNANRNIVVSGGKDGKDGAGGAPADAVNGPDNANGAGEANGPDTKAGPVRSRYFLASTVLPSTISPVLPSPQSFMIVDTSDDALPVLFHQNRSRAGVENLADQLQSADAIIAALRRSTAPTDPATSPLGFTRRYDGYVTWFSAVPIADSPWVVLAFHRVDEVDSIAAGSAAWAMLSWASVTLAAMLVCVLWLYWKRSAWRYLWPFHAVDPHEANARNARTIYRRARNPLFAGAGLITAIAIAALWISIPVVELAVLIATIGAVAVYLWLRTARLTATPLSTAQEKDYRWFVRAMLLFIGVAPMIAFWSDARSLSRDMADAARQDTVAASVDERFQQINALRRFLPSNAQSVAPFNPWGRPEVSVPMRVTRQSGMSKRLYEWHNNFPFSEIRHCDVSAGGGRNAGTAAAPLDAWYCWKTLAGGSTMVGVAPRPSVLPLSLSETVVVITIVLVAGALTLLIDNIVHSGLQSLTGFEIPLGAVTWPRLFLPALGAAPPPRPGNTMPLAEKTLLVAPQQAVRSRVSDPRIAQVVNVGDCLLPLPDSSFTGQPGEVLRLLPDWKSIDDRPPRLVVSGLELILHDATRRRLTLEYLERASATFSATGPTELESLVVITEMAPLERILDAFDTFGQAAPNATSVREELRWARLFQDFSTFSFAPVDKVSSEDLEQEMPEPDDEPSKVLVNELRWLPGSVIDGVLATRESRAILQNTDSCFPLENQRYSGYYSPRIIGWAKSVKPLTVEAALDYMRANLIEYYEQCWMASSFAERVILDAIARNCFVNMSKAIALQSLVRRGLVILDPTPRLMNRSFGLYIRQTERPATLETWRKRQPRSPWSFAKLPLAVALPVLILALMLGAAESGLELSAIIPLLVAGIPALAGSAFRTTRP